MLRTFFKQNLASNPRHNNLTTEVCPSSHLDMSHLVCKLIPPPKGSAASKTSPASFLISEEAISPLKRKAHLKRLSTGMAKRLRLDPLAVQEDLTITMYYKRTQALIPDDRKQIHVQIPFADEIEPIQNKLQLFYKYIVVSS